MTLSKVSTVVSTAWLRGEINKINPAKLGRSLRILDTSFQFPFSATTDFERTAHIPTAVYFDLKDLQTSGQKEGVRFPIPDSNVFQEYVEDLGICNNTHVIAYDKNSSLPSFRTWFMFRLFGHSKVSVLDGGLQKWLREGHPVELEEPVVERGEFKATLRTELLKNYEDIVGHLDTEKYQLLDGRGSAGFLQQGYIPGSRNIPFGDLFTNDGTIKSPEELKRVFSDANVDLNKPMVGSCLTGMTASALVAVADILGKEDVPLYNGSFYEWVQRADESMVVRKRKD